MINPLERRGNSVEEMKVEIYQNAAEVKARDGVTRVLKKEGERRF